MKRFYLCNIGLTVLILFVWGTVVYRFSDRPTGSSSKQVADADAPAQPSVKTYPGDERMGVLSRDVHLDADKIKRKEVVNFRDGARANVHYDSFGRLTKVQEVRSAGDYLVFNFDPKKPEEEAFKNLQVYRKDNTLQRELTPIKSGYESVFYAEDGKTRTCAQIVVKGTVTRLTFFQPDGTTTKATYKMSRDLKSAQLSFFTDSGILRSTQKITPETPMMDCGDECGAGSGGHSILEVKYYREDGQTVWFEQTQSAAAGSTEAEKTQLKEFQPDGKTLAKVVRPIDYRPEELLYDEFGEEGLMASDSNKGFCLEVYDASGKITKKRYLKENFGILRDEVLKPDGTVAETQAYGSGSSTEEEVQSLMNKAAAEDTAFLGGYIVPSEEANHLQVTIAVTQLEL